jgi:hypothetical protein
MERRAVLLAAAVLLVPIASASAQGRGGAQNVPPPTAKAGAAFDMTGYWVSEVTEKWRYRMMVPDKNDYQMVPLNPEGRKVAAEWDPARDQATGEACRSYGAVGLLQIPGRLHITWQDDHTLRLETDSGKQTRLFRFGGAPPANQELSWQGHSSAVWGGGEPRDRRDGFGGPAQDAKGNVVVLPPQRKDADYLKVTTTRLRPGYLQKNGIPYSSNALLEEYFDVFSDPYTKNTWLVVTTVVTDPQYLVEPLIMHAHFKKLADATGWDPTECRADEPR